MLLFRLLSRCPLWLLQGLGALAGWLTWLLSPTYRRRFLANTRSAGLAWTRVRPAVAHAGRMLGELPWLWLRPASKPLGARVQWLDEGLTEAALARGRGLILLTPHMGCFEVAAQAYAEHFGARAPITVLFRPARQAWVRELIDASREREHLAAAPANLAGVRQMIRALRQGQTVGLLPDQVPPEGLGVWAPFFGRPAYTMTLAARLAQQTGATVLQLWGERLPWGRGFVVRVAPGPELAADATPEVGAAAVNTAMETMIRQAPGQYLWGYHRYKQPRRQAQAAATEQAS